MAIARFPADGGVARVIAPAERVRSWRAVLGTANVIRISSRSQRTSTIRPFVGMLRPDLALSPDDTERVDQS